MTDHQAESSGATSPPAGDVARLRKGRAASGQTLLWVVAGVAAILGAVFGVHYYRYAVAHESTDNAFIEGHIIPISPEVAGHVHDYGTKFLVAAGLLNVLAMVDTYEIASGKKD